MVEIAEKNREQRGQLDQYLTFRNGKKSPARTATGEFVVYGSNGQIGQADGYNVNGPSIVIGRVGSYCGSLYYSDSPIWVTDNAIVCEAKETAETRFWYYALQTLRLNERSSGSGQPLLNQSVLRSIGYEAPNRELRIAIAEVLGALDDKITANNHLVETASQLSSALFKESLTESAVEARLSEVCVLLSRGITPKYSEADNSMIVLNQKCVRNKRTDLQQSRRTELSKVREEKILRYNDVLVNSTGQGTLGRVARWTSSEQATADSHVTILRFDPELVNPVCGGFAVLRSERIITSMAEGSTGQTELSRSELGKLKILLPPYETQNALGQELSEITAFSDTLLQENQRLSEARDALLPLLMSGKIRVREAESMIEEAL